MITTPTPLAKMPQQQRHRIRFPANPRDHHAVDAEINRRHKLRQCLALRPTTQANVAKKAARPALCWAASRAWRNRRAAAAPGTLKVDDVVDGRIDRAAIENAPAPCSMGCRAQFNTPVITNTGSTLGIRPSVANVARSEDDEHDAPHPCRCRCKSNPLIAEEAVDQIREQYEEAGHFAAGQPVAGNSSAAPSR